MFDRIIDVIISFGNQINPFFVVAEYEEAIILRLGKYHKTYKPGLHLRIPFADKIFKVSVVPTTMNFGPQSLTTKDGHNIVVSAIIKYSVIDIKTFILEVWDIHAAMEDVVKGIIREVITEHDYSEIKVCESIIYNKARRAVRRWGIDLLAITFINFVKMKTLRIFVTHDNIKSSTSD